MTNSLNTPAADCPERIAYSIKEAAAVSGLGRTTIYSLIAQGELRRTKIGQRTLIPRAELERILQVDSA
ncbi:helix-turn-helix domain-containing protein [Sphingomonas sinipercae]|uniref:Helix-turn-helix domain-containing protein n=1 Tax=Sphingomonas sinipercae TaxID=2714944 RepID=A0A6G7ZKA8_9SPHN|nr:helix-turn-helix domain-containing protein [Sphingomonas sinipercae]QIL01355.1 helix-turn-helix domain-containing protein [Sphingomonas sinipercae]